MPQTKPFLIAIHGPNGSGKTTMGKLLAHDLNIPCMNTDDIFYAFAAAVRNELHAAWKGYKQTQNPDVLMNMTDRLASCIDMRSDNERLIPFYNDSDITRLPSIKDLELNSLADELKAIPVMISMASRMLLEAAKGTGAILEGRYARQLFPYADIQFFLTADMAKRTERMMRCHPGRYRSKEHAASELGTLTNTNDQPTITVDSTNLTLAETLELMRLHIKATNPHIFLDAGAHPEPIALLQPGTKEYLRLYIAASMISDDTGIPCRVQDTYFDYGAGMQWTTLIAGPPDGFSYQMLNPKEQARILYGSLPDALTAIRETAAKLYAHNTK